MITSLNPRVHKRALARVLRQMNKNIENDELWKGRFYVRAVNSPRIRRYEDGSGISYWITLEATDRKTGITQRAYGSVDHWAHWNGFYLWQFMNDFIIKDCNVWAENPRPTLENTPDWRK